MAKKGDSNIWKGNVETTHFSNSYQFVTLGFAEHP